MGVPPDAGLRMAVVALAWLLGIGWQLQQPALWPASSYAALAAAACLMALAALRRPGVQRVALLALACAMLAFAFTGARALSRLAPSLDEALEGQDLVLTGVVSRLPQLGPQGVRFVFEVESAAHDGSVVTVPRRVSLVWSQAFDGEPLGAAAPPTLRAGQRWQLAVRMRQPHGNLNPHGFDFELWLFEQGIRATGSVRDGAATRLLADTTAYPVERWRQAIRDSILLRVPDAQAAGVLAALSVGDQAAIGRDDWELFRHTGVAHLMSISGLHVTMFAWLAAGVVGMLWRSSARLMLWLPAPLAARWGGVALAAAYALLAGWGVPAQRTLWMLATVALLRSIGRRWPQPLVLLAAAVVVTALDPWAMLQPGFWLSFVAVALLMGSEPASRAAPAGGGWHRRGIAVLAGGVRTQAVASLGLAPLSLVFFQQVSIVGFVANLVAIPLVTLLVTPLALLGIVWPWLWLPAAALVQALAALLSWMSGWPDGVWTAAAAPAWGVASGVLGGVLLLLPLPWRLRLLGLPLLLPLLAPPVERPAQGDFEVLVADIGQGSAVLVRTREHLLVYDAGPRYSAETDAGQRVLLPLLRARGENRIDTLVLSHRDIDHVGGALSLIERAEVRELRSSLSASHPLRQQRVPHLRCEAGQSWRWDGVDFEVLHPLAADYETAAKANAMSCVLRVAAPGGRSLLLAGDIEAAQERLLLARSGAALRSQVLLVPHHGSRSSSSEAFVLAVAPGAALVQAAYRSRFGHPAPEVAARYRALGIELVRTDECGAWSWTVQGSTRCEREAAARYWHHRTKADAQQ